MLELKNISYFYKSQKDKMVLAGSFGSMSRKQDMSI